MTSGRSLILTGQRRDENRALRWSEIDMDERLIRLPPRRCKNGKTMIKRKIAFHVVPLAINEAMPRGTSDFVFGKLLAHWVLHELRHSVTTHLIESRTRCHRGKAIQF